MENTSKPQLTENGIRYFLSNTLTKCKTIQENYYNMFNIVLFLLFITLLVLLLKYKYKGKNNIVEIKKKNLEKKNYILSCIHKMNFSNNIKLEQDRERHSLLTSLPLWK